MTVFTWSGSGTTTAWADSANWTGGAGSPGRADLAVFGRNDSTVTGTASVGAIEISASQTFSGTQLTVGGLMGDPFAMAVVGNGQATFTNGASLTAPTLAVQAGPFCSLAFTQSSVTTTSTVIGAASGSNGLVTFDHGLWQNSHGFDIGDRGNGALGIGAGGSLFVGTNGRQGFRGSMALGTHAGGDGVLGLDGGATAMLSGNLTVGGTIGVAHHGIGQITVSSNAVLYANGTLSINAGSTASLAAGYVFGHILDVSKGALVSGSGALQADTMQMDGTVRASGTLDVSGSVSGAGSFLIGAGSTLGLYTADILAKDSIAFLSNDGTLGIGPEPSISSLIHGFSIGDAIDAGYVDHVSWNQAPGILTLLSGSSTVEGTLHLAGNYANDVFSVTEHGTTGVITLHAPPHHG